jgi:hypothetical protein
MHIHFPQPAMKLSLQKHKLVRRLKQRSHSPDITSTKRQANLTPASHAVFATAELLEAILLHLESRDLLVAAQRVCRTWCELVKTSFRLQEVLFLREPTSSSLSRRLSPRSSRLALQPSGTTSPPSPRPGPGPGPGPALQPHTQRQFHPLLLSAFGPLFRPGLDPSALCSRALATNKTTNKTTTNSSSSSTQAHGGYWMLGMQGMEALDLPIADCNGGRKRSRHQAFVRRGASWRRMQVAQPPVVRVGFVRQRAAGWEGDGRAQGLRRMSVGRRGRKERRKSAASSSSSSSSSTWSGSSAGEVGGPRLEHRVLHFPHGLRMGEYYDLLDSIVWGASTSHSAREARGHHFAWASWDPARTLHALRQRRELGAVQDVLGEWLDGGGDGWGLGDADDIDSEAGPRVDMVVGEDATTPFSAARCDFYKVVADVEEKVQDVAWRFRCKEFCDPLAGL